MEALRITERSIIDIESYKEEVHERFEMIVERSRVEKEREMERAHIGNSIEKTVSICSYLVGVSIVITAATLLVSIL